MAIFQDDNDKPLTICDNTDIDTCYIPSDQIKKGDTFVAAIQCQEECNFEFKTYWSTVQELIPNNEIKFSFSDGTEAQMYHLNLEN